MPAYLGLLLLATPAFVYYFVVNKNIKRTSLYLMAFFGSLFVVRLVTQLFSINLGTWALNGVTLMSVVNVVIATLLALFLVGDRVEIKNVAWLAGIVIIGQLISMEALKSVTMGLI